MNTLQIPIALADQLLAYLTDHAEIDPAYLAEAGLDAYHAEIEPLRAALAAVVQANKR